MTFLVKNCAANEELGDTINHHIGEGWQIYQLDVLPTYGPQGSGIPTAVVTLFKQMEASEDEEEPGAMPMKG